MENTLAVALETALASVEAPVKDIAPLDSHAKMADVIAKVNELVARANHKRDRGPVSTRTMTESDAKDVVLGKFKDLTHTKAAEATGLSYGQIYSARKGFTFKPVYKQAVSLGLIKES